MAEPALKFMSPGAVGAVFFAHIFPCAQSAMAVSNGTSSDDPSSRAPSVVAFPDFRLFDSAQDILDHNKRIIKEIKINHEAQTPEALARNCLLIRELNTNIKAVMCAYSSIGESFQQYMSQWQQLSASKHGSGGNASGGVDAAAVGTGAGGAAPAGTTTAAEAAVPQAPAPEP